MKEQNNRLLIFKQTRMQKLNIFLDRSGIKKD